MANLCFTVEGAFVTEHFRARWVEEYDPEVQLLLLESMVGMDTTHADLILSGKKKLIGCSNTEITMVDDDATELNGKPLLTRDAARAFVKGNDNLGKLMVIIVKDMYQTADDNYNDAREVSTIGHYRYCKERMSDIAIETSEEVIKRETPRFFGRICSAEYDRPFGMFISQVVARYEGDIRRAGDVTGFDYWRDFERTWKASRDGWTDDKTLKEEAEAVEYVEPEPVAQAASSFLGSLAESTLDRLKDLGLPNADKYRAAANKRIVEGELSEIITATLKDYESVEYGFLTPDGKLYVCGFYEHDDLEYLLEEEGLWKKDKMISLKDGPSAAEPCPKAWYFEGEAKKVTKKQVKTIIDWCEATGNDPEDVASCIM